MPSADRRTIRSSLVRHEALTLLKKTIHFRRGWHRRLGVRSEKQQREGCELLDEAEFGARFWCLRRRARKPVSRTVQPAEEKPPLRRYESTNSSTMGCRPANRVVF